MARGVELVGDIKKLERDLMKLAQPRFDRAGREVGEMLTSSTIQRFATSRAPNGTPWQPLSLSSTYGSLSRKDYTKRGQIRKSSERRLQMRKILIDTARLRNSISYKVRGSKVHVGTNLAYARVHQMGGMAGRNKKVKIPARPYLGISSADRHEIEQIVLEHLGNL